MGEDKLHRANHQPRKLSKRWSMLGLITGVLGTSEMHFSPVLSLAFKGEIFC